MFFTKSELANMSAQLDASDEWSEEQIMSATSDVLGDILDALITRGFITTTGEGADTAYSITALGDAAGSERFKTEFETTALMVRDLYVTREDMLKSAVAAGLATQ